MSQEGSEKMQVDDNNKKRDREFHDPREEEEPELYMEGSPVTTEMASVGARAQKLTLEDIMSFMQKGLQENKDSIDKGNRENRENFSSLSKEIASTKREAQEGKLLAAKATTMAKETQDRLETLEKRVTQLETNPGKALSPPPGLQARASYGEGGRDWDQLGGENGDTAIIGGFRPFADKDEKQTEWDEIRGKMPEELKLQMADEIVPRSLGSIVIVKIRTQGTPADTRRAMLKWTQDFKKEKLEIQTAGETEPRVFYAAPSKPFAMRQRNALLSNTMEALKMMGGPDAQDKLRMDIPSGRILYDRTVLVERARSTGEPMHHTATMKKILSGPHPRRPHCKNRRGQEKEGRGPENPVRGPTLAHTTAASFF